MPKTKLDLSAAWEGATRSISRNREILLLLAGVFFFLPLFAIFLLVFGSDLDWAAATNGDSASAEAFAQAVRSFLATYWWALIIAALFQITGGITILRVIGDPQHQTVRQTIVVAFALLLPMLVAQILTGLVPQLPSLLADAIGGPETMLGAALGLIALPVSIYLMIKFALVSPVVAIEKERNPINAISRSWRMTKGNSFRIFAFFALFFIAAGILFLVLSLIVGLGFALLGERGEQIGSAAFWALFVAATYLVSYAVLANIHRQLTRSGASVPRTARD